jgi:hypothetical protein
MGHTINAIGERRPNEETDWEGNPMYNHILPRGKKDKNCEDNILDLKSTECCDHN